jgi:Peptidase_C39 like family
VRLMRRSGSSGPSPTLDTVGAVASRLPSGTPPVSKPGPGRGIVLDVPRYSQMAHRGHSPKYGGGGEAWCSPTSTSMVLGYYDALPPPRAYAWVGAGHRDPWVDHAARMTYDAAYEGTGNWPFNTAYAARLAGHAFVTRMRSLREAERLIAAGVPVVASISFGSGQLDGAPISASSGHLLVIVGFTSAGDVVVNDPAARTRKGVRRTYDRAQFERAWLPTTGGLAYVIHDGPLPR